METSILKKAGELLLERSRYRQWYRCVAGMAAVVVFVTVYALILPAITLEKETFCGMEEHTHTEDCYENVLICAQEGTGTGAASEEAETSGTSEDSAQSDHPSEEDGSGGQEETEEQSSSDKEEPEAEAHEHSDGCYEKKLICGLEEHMHSEKCYEKQAASEEEKEHVHTEDCYDEDGKLICREEEAEEKTEENPAEEESGKEGGEEEEPAVFCGLEEHVHTDDCYDTDGELVCALEEHEHTEACCSEAIFMLADADEAEWIEVENESELSEAVARVQNGGQISIRVTADFGTGRTYELREPGNEPAADPQNGSERGTEAVLDLNGHTITRTGNGYLFKVSGAKLTVCDQSEAANDPAAVMVGEADAAEEGAASYDKDNKTLTYYFTEYSSDPAELVRKKAVADLSRVGAIEGSGGDGLLYVEKQGILDIAGGRFTNTGGKHALVAEWTGDGREGNTIHISGGYLCGSGSNDKGGGVYFGGGNLTISGGVIAANQAAGTAGHGGGVCAEVNGKVVMTGGVISGNTATKQGGGLYVKNGWLNMTGGEIVGNQASGNGGGLCVEDGELTVQRSVIAYNTSGGNGSGGGIAAWNGSVGYSISGSQIIGNTAGAQGGGIYVNRKLTVVDSTIRGNTVSRTNGGGKGGGIRLADGPELELTNSTIADNEAESGGGVHVDGNVSFHSGTVRGNAATKTFGGGIYAGNGLAFEDGTVASNRAAENGGGMYVAGSLTFAKGTVSSNEAVRYGGGIYLDGKNRSESAIKGGTIAGNQTTMKVVAEDVKEDNTAREGTAASGGGGVYVTNSTFAFEGGEVSGNTASLTGGGMFIHKTAFTMSGGTVKDNTAARGEGGGIRFCADSDGLIQAGEGRQVSITGNRTDTTHDWGGGGIFVSQDGRLRIYNALVTDNSAGGFGGGVGGCSTGRLDLSAEQGTAIYGNTAAGTTMSTTTKKQEDRIAKNDSRFMYGDYYQDYFCAYVSKVSGSMLGGGDYDWIGSRDYQAVRIRYGELASASQMMGLTAHPSQSAREAAAGRASVLISGNYSNTHGGGVMSNGILVLGGETPERFDVGLRIDARKRFADEKGNPYPLDPGQFQFVLLDPATADLRYDADNRKIAFNPESTVIAPVGNDADGDIFFFLSYEQTGEYTYYLLEKAEAVEGIQYDTAVYKISVTVGEQGTGDAMALIVSGVQAQVLSNPESLPQVQIPPDPDSQPNQQEWQSCGVSVENAGSTVKTCIAKISRQGQNDTFVNTGSKPLYFRIRKQNSEDKEALINVGFTLEEEAEDGQSGQSVSRRTGSDGFIAFPVEKGKNYLLRETEPLAGYLGAGPWRVAVDGEGTITLSEASDSEGEGETTITPTSAEGSDDYYYIIENTPRTFALPDTGDAGTEPYAAAGILLLLGAGLLYRKKCREGGMHRK